MQLHIPRLVDCLNKCVISICRDITVQWLRAIKAMFDPYQPVEINKLPNCSGSAPLERDLLRQHLQVCVCFETTAG